MFASGNIFLPVPFLPPAGVSEKAWLQVLVVKSSLFKIPKGGALTPALRPQLIKVPAMLLSVPLCHKQPF